MVDLMISLLKIKIELCLFEVYYVDQNIIRDIIAVIKFSFMSVLLLIIQEVLKNETKQQKHDTRNYK